MRLLIEFWINISETKVGFINTIGIFEIYMAEGRFTNPVVASLAGVKDFFAKQELASRFSEKDRADDMTVLITGANS